MSVNRFSVTLLMVGVASGLALLLTPPLLAERLQVPEQAPLAAHLGAGLLLWGHILGGAIGLTPGPVAILSPKGKPVHRAAGKVFVVSMAMSFVIGAGVAPFLETGQKPNFIAGILALYLLLSAWRAANARDSAAGWPEWTGLAVASACAVAGCAFAYIGAQDPTGTVDGAPPDAFVIFIVAGLFAAYGEIRVLLRGTLSGASRILRHIWRMCTTLFIAAGSFFFGQPQVLPAWAVDSLAQYGPVLFPLVALVVWSVIVRWQSRPRRSGGAALRPTTVSTGQHSAKS